MTVMIIQRINGSEENWDFDDPTTSRKKAYLRKKETRLPLEVVFQNPIPE